MAPHRDVQNFTELRVGFVGLRDFAGGMQDFADAALRFLDENGIGVGKGPDARPSGRPRKANGVAVLRETVKRHYKQRRATVAPTYISQSKRGRVGRPPKQPKLTSGQRVTANRQASAELLAQLDPVEVRHPNDPRMKNIGALVRRGYAKKKNGGYIRTGKEFVVSKTAAVPINGTMSDALTAQQAAKLLQVSDSYVRALVKQKKLKGRVEHRPWKGIGKPIAVTVVERDEVNRYLAERNAIQ